MAVETEDEAVETTEIEPDDLRERIRNRAYDLFLERSRAGVPGDEYTDWLTAEAEIRAELAQRR